MYLVLSTTDQAKAVGEVTQHVSETTSEDSEQNVGETTVFWPLFITQFKGGMWRGLPNN